MISTVSFTINYTTKTCRLTDTTDYSQYGLVPSTNAMKFLGVISFQGDQLYSKLTTLDPLIDLQSGDLYFEFPAVLDLNGNVANGIYSLTEAKTVFQFGSSSVTSSSSTQQIVFDGSGATSTAIEAGASVTIVKTSPAPVITTASTAVSSVDSSGDLVLTIVSGASDYSDCVAVCAVVSVAGSDEWTAKGCTQSTANVNFSYDCEYGDSGSWSVSNTTSLASNETISSLNCTVIYPSWTTANPSFNPQVVLTSLPYPTAPNTETPLATGTYTVSLSEEIVQVQEDGLIMQYTASITKEFSVSCAGTLCGLVPCIENLRKAHAAELKANKVSKYQVYVDNVLMYYIEALNYKACGDLDKYKETIDLLKGQLDSSGCDCDCCDDQTYYWVSNNSAASVIESLLQNIQYRLNDGVPGATDDETAGVQVGAIWQDYNTGIEYRCVDNSPGAAVWEVYYDTDEVNNKVESVTGTAVDNTDPLNPVIDTPDASEIAFDPNPALGPADTVQEAIDAVTTLSLSKVTSVVGLNTNNSDPENPVIQISVDGTTITGAGTPLSPLVANSSLPYTSIVLEINSGTSLTQIYNNTGATLTASSPLTGLFSYTASSAIFTNNKTWISYTPKDGSSGIRSYIAVRNSTTVINFFNYIGGTLSNTDSSGYMEIRIYS